MSYRPIQFDPSGVIYDVDPHDAPADVWTDVINMRFKNAAAEKIGGDDSKFTTTGQPTHLLFNGNHDDPLWIYLGDAIARATDFSADKDIEGTALTSGTDWDSCLFNLFPVVNNTLDPPRYWDNDFTTPGTLAALPAFPANTICKAIRPYRSFLVALNTTNTSTSAESPNRVLWSDSSDAGALPASWDITDPTTLAGDAYLTDDRGKIIDGAQLRDYFAIYKTHSTYLMRLVGDANVMRIDKVQVNSGCLSKNCITEFKGRHFVVADGDIILFDGANVESIAEKRVRGKIFNEIDTDNFNLAHVARYDRLNEIWIAYPTAGQSQVNRVAIWNWRDNNWTFRDLVDSYYVASGLTNFTPPTTWSAATGTWATTTRTWKSPSSNPTFDALAIAKTLSIDAVDDTQDFNTTVMLSRLEKATMDLGDPDHVKMIKSVTPRVTAEAGTVIYIRVGTQMAPDDPITWSTERAYTVGTDRETHFSVKGRFISVRMRTQDMNTSWKCHGFYIKAKRAGKH